MRYLVCFVTVFILCSCQSATPQEENQTDGLEDQTNVLEQQSADEDSLVVSRTYITDSLYVSNRYTTELKGGYRLEYRVYVEPNDPDTLQAMLLMNGDSEIKEFGVSSYGLPLKNMGYIGVDFEELFVFAQSYGSGNPHYIQLIDKQSGREVLTGIWVDANENEQVLLYITKEKEQLTIYDIQNGNEIVVTGFDDSKCAELNSGRLVRDCVEIDIVTSNKIVLKIDTDQERIVQEYNR